MKSLITTSFTMPGRCAIELSSTDSRPPPNGALLSAPTYGGRTTRPCNMPGKRRSWT
ncbi:hypothetical protein M5585_16145 [Serratia ureilytica]